MHLIVFSLVALTTLLAGLLLAPRLQIRRLQIDTRPDVPLPFGFDMSWLAVRTSATSDVVQVLGLREFRPASWNSGLGLVYDQDFADHYVFVSPPIDGWTLIVGVGLPMPAGERFVEKLMPMLRKLGDRFPDVQYFAAFPAIDFFAWARLLDGSTVRAFAAGESGAVWDLGRLTQDERKLGLKRMEVRGIRDRRGDIGADIVLHPTEDHVLSLAAAWGFDPMRPADTNAQVATGWIASVPPAWRAERARRVA